MVNFKNNPKEKKKKTMTEEKYDGVKMVSKKKRKKWGKKNIKYPSFTSPYGCKHKKTTSQNPQICTDEQAKIDQRLHKLHKRGLERVTRKSLMKMARKYDVKIWQRTSAAIIVDLRVVAAGMS